MTNSQWPLEELSALAARAARAASARISARKPLDHQSNNLYDAWADGRHFIVKEYLKPEEWNDSPLREFHSLELLAPLDIAPRPIHYAPAAPPRNPVVIYEYLHGEMWDRRKPDAAQLAQLAEVWLKMNSAPTEGLWLSRNFGQSLAPLVERFRGYFHAHADWASAEFKAGERAAGLCLTILDQRRAVIDELAQCDPVLCFCRSDPRFANVIQRPDGRAAYVDWEDAGLRDPATDVADLLTAPNQEDLLTPDEWQSFLRPYLAARETFDQNLWHRIVLYQALFQLYFLAVLVYRNVERLRAGQATMAHVNGMPINLRLRRYLARALAWPEMEFSRQLESLEGIEFFPCAA